MLDPTHESGSGGGGGGGGGGCGGSGGETVGSNSNMSGVVGDFFEGDRSTGGNRWPKQETLALLKIRSDMDGVFRDSSLKGPLWEQVSRKMAELGYNRSSKKCKEKFENVYKYNKRTKYGRVGKSDAKTYRFFDQLQALEHRHSSPSSPFPPPLPPAQAAVPVSMVIPAPNDTVTSNLNPQQTHVYQVNATPIMSQPPPQQPPYHHHPTADSPSKTPSWTSSDDEFVGKRKRKWKEFFERMMKEVIDKQEELQKRFLEAVDKREHDWLVREEARKAQEMRRLNQEHEILVQQRSIYAAKDAALIEMLKKLCDQPPPPPPPPPQPLQVDQPHDQANTVSLATLPVPQPQPQPQPQTQVHVQANTVSLATPIQAPPQPQPKAPPQTLMKTVDTEKTDDGGEKQVQEGSSRWPKAEVEALINLRTQLDHKYQENGPKGPLWEEISSLMKKLGYNRNAKRCKEKWENINKYFKKVKESNKKRPQDSKTCPYFHQLDALYQHKTTTIINMNPSANIVVTYAMKPENLNTMGPIMAQPDQPWPVQYHDGSDNDSVDDSDDDDEDDQVSGGGGGGGYEVVVNNNTSNNNSNNTSNNNNNGAVAE